MLGDTVFSWALGDAGVLDPARARAAVFRHDHVQGGVTSCASDLRADVSSPGSDVRPTSPFGNKVADVALTVVLIRPARVTLRALANARRAGRFGDALVTLPIVASRTLAWFAGEVVGVLQDARGHQALMRVLMLAHNVTERLDARSARSRSRAGSPPQAVRSRSSAVGVAWAWGSRTGRWTAFV